MVLRSFNKQKIGCVRKKAQKSKAASTIPVDPESSG